jgi:hypothetical protein
MNNAPARDEVHPRADDSPGIRTGPGAGRDEFEPERLPDTGSAPTTGESTPNPSHPVRSHIRPATWRQVSPRDEPLVYCVCGVALPTVVPARCPECGRATLTPLPLKV